MKGNHVFTWLSQMDANGHVEVVRYLLANYPGMDFVAKIDNVGNTPLLLCLDEGQDGLEIARLLLENGAQVNAINSYGRSLLHKVAVQGSLVLVQEFIQYGADLLAADEDGNTPFDVAIAAEEGEIANYILTVAYKDQVFAHEGNRSIYAILEGAEYQDLVEEDESEEEQDTDEESLLQHQQQIVLEDNSEKEQDADEESVQQQQRVILQVCLPIGKLTVNQFRALLQSFGGVLMRQPDNTGAIPFHVACQTAAPAEILNLLLEEYPGALQIADNNNSLPIHFACQANVPSLGMLNFLLERDPAAVRALDNTGSLPLHHLCRSKPLDDTVSFCWPPMMDRSRYE